MSSQTNSSVPWLVWSSQTNEVIVSGELSGQGELPSLAQYAQGRQVTVLVNGADVRLYRHMMATKPNRQIIKALPFMLEDELAQDIDSLFFAVAESGFDKAQQQHWVDVAIIEKSLVVNWLAMLGEAGLSVKNMVPEALCLPYERASESELVAMTEFDNGWLFRTGEWQGTFVESSWLPVYAQQWQGELEEDAKPVELQYYSALPNDIGAQLIESAKVNLVAKEPELAILMLARGAERVNWNLLQGDLAPKKAVSKNWMMWRSAAALFVIVLLIEFATMGVNWYQAETRLAIAKQQLIDEYQQAFPREKVRVALLRRQLTRKVAQATGGNGPQPSGFLSLMAKLTPVLQQYNAVKSESYRYDGKRGELRISATAPSFQQFERFKNSLEGLGLQVQQGAVNNEGEMVSGSLSIKEAG